MAVSEAKNPSCYGSLIREENVGKMELLESFGWFGAEELENFICTARRERKLESLVWLMRLKDQKYGYKRKNLTFSQERKRNYAGQ